MFGRQTTEGGTDSGLNARIAGLSAWREKAPTNSPLPEKMTVPPRSGTMIAPPPSVKMIAPVPTIEPESTIEERLVIARDELSARLGAKIPPVRRALLGPSDMAKIVDGAVQAYFVRHAMNVDPLACRDLVTDIVETLIAPVAAAEGENRVRETIPLADVLERLITSATLRGAIRSKLRTGASREMISFLIRDFAPAGLHSDRTDGRALWLEAELIPHRGRKAFLAALSDLPNLSPVVRSSRRPVAKRSLASWVTSGMSETVEN